MRYAIILYLILFTGEWGFTQSDLQIGAWKSYLPYKFGYSVTQSPDAIFYGTQWAILKINKEDLSLEYFSKIDSLSDVGVRLVRYSEDRKVLMIIYENSNIDLVTDRGVVNLNQIATNAQIVKDRTINAVYLKGDFAYFATGFGLVQLDIFAEEFGFTTFTDVAIVGITGDDQNLIISTETGYFTAPDDGSINLADFSAWSPLGFDEGLPIEGEGHAVVNIDGKIYAGINDEVYVYEDDRFNLVHREPGFFFGYAALGPEGTLLGWLPTQGIDGKKLLLKADGGKGSVVDCARRATEVIVDEQNRVWYTDFNRNFKYSEGFTGSCHQITPDRPPTHNATQMAAYDGKLYVATGGVTISYGYLFRQDGLYTNEDGTWKTINRLNNNELRSRDMRDFLSIIASPDGTIYVGTFWDGLIEYREDVVFVYDQNNSSLQNSVVNPDRNRVTDMTYDADGNLWMLNHDAPRPVSVFTKDGEWKNFALRGGTNAERIAVDLQGYKWIALGGQGLELLDTGEDIMDESDDRSRSINVNNSALKSNTINAIAVDKNGTVWVGTSIGLIKFNCPDFADNCQGNAEIVEENGIAGELLGEENVKAIAIDGGNRKWFGTSNGVFVQSADAKRQIAAFNERNSPLFDNSINYIEIDETTGEVYLATNKGIISYRGEATTGQRFHTNDVYAFPNPVRPGYNGPIAIKGLAENSNVKITDVQGALVYETIAVGGQAIWYGEDLSGERAASGVYLVFSTAVQNQINPDAAVTKIMLVN